MDITQSKDWLLLFIRDRQILILLMASIFWYNWVLNHDMEFERGPLEKYCNENQEVIGWMDSQGSVATMLPASVSPPPYLPCKLNLYQHLQILLTALNFSRTFQTLVHPLPFNTPASVTSFLPSCRFRSLGRNHGTEDDWLDIVVTCG